MNNLILQEFISIDGFVADRNKKTSFFESSPYGLGEDIELHQKHFIESLELILLGANTYRLFVDYWPEAPSKDNTIAELINVTPKLVFSKSLNGVHWGKWGKISLVAEDAVVHIRSLKNTAGKKMVVWGSISLAKSLLIAGLFDEIQLFTVPVAIGKGYHLFPEEFELLPLTLINTKAFSNGALLHTYRPPKCVM